MEYYSLSCQKKKKDKWMTCTKRDWNKTIVDKFQNNVEEYLKIRKTVEEKAISILSGRKELLMLAPLSFAESMRNDPYKYSSLIYYITSSSTTDIQAANIILAILMDNSNI